MQCELGQIRGRFDLASATVHFLFFSSGRRTDPILLFNWRKVEGASEVTNEGDSWRLGVGIWSLLSSGAANNRYVGSV
jgi:hypothetical protein